MQVSDTARVPVTFRKADRHGMLHRRAPDYVNEFESSERNDSSERQRMPSLVFAVRLYTEESLFPLDWEMHKGPSAAPFKSCS